MNTSQSKTIVFITGASLSNSIWDDWRTFFESNGFITIAPSWPHKEATTAELRKRHPDTDIGSTGLEDLIDYYAEILKQLPEKTILIGHSTGGLVTQLLLQQELALAGIVIHTLPPRGVHTWKYSFLRSVWGPLGLLGSEKKPFLMSFEQWQYAYTNGMPIEEQQAGYDRYVVPESRKVWRDGWRKIAAVDFNKVHVPLLFVSGSTDRLVPASLNALNYRNYRQDASITDYKEFEGRNHFVLAQSSWHEDARFILNWIEGLGNRPR